MTGPSNTELGARSAIPANGSHSCAWHVCRRGKGVRQGLCVRGVKVGLVLRQGCLDHLRDALEEVCSGFGRDVSFLHAAHGGHGVAHRIEQVRDVVCIGIRRPGERVRRSDQKGVAGVGIHARRLGPFRCCQ